MSWDTRDFKEKLDHQHSFPGLYLFKFIVPTESVSLIEDLWSSGEITKKPSSNGKYTSVTINAEIKDSDSVISIYERASKIEGCIAL